MDDQSFDTLARSVSEPSSRRGLLGGLTVLALGLGGAGLPDSTTARKKRKHRRKNKKKTPAILIPTCPTGTEDCRGTCVKRCCPPGAEDCQGMCVSLCPTGQTRNPLTCACCRINMVSCTAIGANDVCCSGTCSPVSAVVNTCAGRAIAAPCDFDAQCASGFCSPAGLCLFAAS
ncbi:MAG: hypothetical protein M3Z20_15680 [Chloroflexota bacterium]|nr:hypothetical protein [Chloroflexota bacterium]